MDSKQITENQLMSEDLPCERFLRIGAEAMTDAELLAIVLRTGVAGASALDLARRILLLGAYPRTGLLGLHDVSIEELQQIPGIGEVKAVRLKAIAELSVRMSRAAAKTGICIHEPGTIANYFMEKMRHLHREHVILVCLDSKGQILSENTLSEGNVNLSLVSPRSVFLEALRFQAVNLILLHNHPSGDPTPSMKDIKLTRELYELSHMMEIPLLDHIIIGDQRYYSFLEHKALN